MFSSWLSALLKIITIKKKSTVSHKKINYKLGLKCCSSRSFLLLGGLLVFKQHFREDSANALTLSFSRSYAKGHPLKPEQNQGRIFSHT